MDHAVQTGKGVRLSWRRRYGFEFKFQDAPRTSRTMHTVLRDLGLDRLYVVYPGAQRYPLAERIEVVPLAAVEEGLREG